MFECLNPDELDIVLEAMQNVKKKDGELIIKEGDDGDNLYVVESGHLICTKLFVPSFNNFRRKTIQNQLSSKSILLVKPLVNLLFSTMLQELPL